MKRWSYLSLLLMLLASVLPTNAQSPWYAYFYNHETLSLSYVTADGQSQNFSLGLESNPLAITDRSLVFANTRQELAYCTVAPNNGQIPSQGATTFVIRDIPNQQNIHEIDLGLSDYCHAGVYNSNDTLVTVGILRHFGDAQAANPEAPNWEILLIDTASGAILDSLNSNNPATAMVMPYEGGSPNDFFVPSVFSIEGEQLIFEATPIEGRGLAYSYNLNNQVLSLYEHWGYSYNRFGNEELWVTRLEEYPAASLLGPVNPQNAVMYADSSGTEKVIYYTADWGIQRAIFINGGREIAIYLLMAFDPNWDMSVPREDTSKWIVIDREGNESDLLSHLRFGDETTQHYLEIQPAFEGYGLLESRFNLETSATGYQFSLINDTVQTIVWDEEDGATWSLVDMAEMPYQEFPAFPAFDLSSISMGQ